MLRNILYLISLPLVTSLSLVALPAVATSRHQQKPFLDLGSSFSSKSLLVASWDRRDRDDSRPNRDRDARYYQNRNVDWDRRDRNDDRNYRNRDDRWNSSDRDPQSYRNRDGNWDRRDRNDRYDGGRNDNGYYQNRNQDRYYQNRYNRVYDPNRYDRQPETIRVIQIAPR